MSNLENSWRHVQAARAALLRGKPNVDDAKRFLDRAEEEGFVKYRGRRENNAHCGVFERGVDDVSLDYVDHARRELDASPPRPHHALVLLDRATEGG